MKLLQTKPAKAAIGVTALVAASAANAALPAEAQTAIDAVSAFVTDILAAVWPIATALTVGFVGIKLFKKGANKAS
ncbi:conserved exported hypothetical protein [Vibrio aestuarianus]|uniref:major coat protein n=1 Tax=Vibrio aestuarianus TaxID=28171 RepID=UPI001456153B|nr:major coat protein [Vibrio aestuarianus]NLS63625.1 phage coat protein [Vibrio aestuarianus subsp. francensis]CAH8189071.1 conserved exported hypothetical protein [Vibrio aestuarianus]